MYSLSSLLKSLPRVTRSRMVSSGYALWLVWPEAMNNAAIHTLKDYGGMPMVEEENQALWWFPNSEALRALARLQVWSRLGKGRLYCQVMPVTFMVGFNLDTTLSLPAELVNQQVAPAEGFNVWVHPKFSEDIRKIPGLGLRDGNPDSGMAKVAWKLLEADQGLDYETVRGWYFIVKPLGRMQEKDSVLGWRAFFAEIQTLLQRMNIKYISDETEWFVIFALDSMRMLRSMCKELLELVRSVKASGKPYWPTVTAAIQQKGLPFTNELPRKFHLDWSKLAPDYPHLQYRDALLLREWFKINEIQYGMEGDSLEAWCNVSLKGDEGEAAGSMEVALPRNLVKGQGKGCFYCGLKSHEAGQCPTRQLKRLREDVWSRLAMVDLDDLNKGLGKLDEQLEAGGKSLVEMLTGGKSLEELLVRAVFEINAPAQYRMLRIVWRSRGKEWPQALRQLAPEEGKFIWQALEVVLEGDLEEASTLLKQAGLKYTRSYQPPSLQGFVAAEHADYHQANFYWEESERLSYTPLQRSLFLYLQGRAKEMDDDMNGAAMHYRSAHELSPSWTDPLYRHGVCLVKMGFIGQALEVFYDLLEKDPNVFTRLLLDPDLERGRIHIMSALWEKWREAEESAKQEKEHLEKLSSDISQWFDPDHPFHDKAKERIEEMSRMAQLRNYVAFRHLSQGLQGFTEELDREVDQEIGSMREKIRGFQTRLREVQKEASWFPFPRLLRDFNREFNSCVERINWINSQQLKSAEVFRRAQRYIMDIEENLGSLVGRLVSLRIIRDGTLFTLILGRNFIWFELIGLGLSLLSIPAFLWFTKGMEHNWLVEIIVKQKWEVQKALVLILSIVALALAALRSAVVFEKRKRELFEKQQP